MSDNDKESYIVKKISFFVIIAIILVILIVLFFGYIYVSSGLKPVDKNDTSTVEIEIPLGSSSSGIANILEKKRLLKTLNYLVCM